MRFECKPYPKIGAARIKTAFLLFPKEINREVRWLEFASWQERYTRHSITSILGARTEWMAEKWIDNKKEKNNVGQPK